MTEQQNKEKKPKQVIFAKWKIILPVILGFSIAFWLLYSAMTNVEYYKVKPGTGNYVWVDQNQNRLVDYTDGSDFELSDKGNYARKTFSQAWNNIQITTHTLFFLFLAVMMMVVRDFGYVIRIRNLTDKELSWKQSFRVIMIWEFASAVTPSIVGGVPVAMFILKKEGINLGRSTAIVLLTTLLDELFYVLIVPVVLLCAGTSALFPPGFSQDFFGFPFNPFSAFLVGFSIILFLVLFLFMAIFVVPFWFKRFLIVLSRLFFLKKFRSGLEKMGDDIIVTSNELKGKKITFWLHAFGATILSWMGRFMVINCIVMAFAPFTDQLLLFARQLSMWVILLISPTPGGSGIAEYAFSGFLNDFIPFGMVAILAILWRIISYYPYLFIGAWIIPRWLSKTNSSNLN